MKPVSHYPFFMLSVSSPSSSFFSCSRACKEGGWLVVFCAFLRPVANRSADGAALRVRPGPRIAGFLPIGLTPLYRAVVVDLRMTSSVSK